MTVDKLRELVRDTVAAAVAAQKEQRARSQNPKGVTMNRPHKALAAGHRALAKAERLASTHEATTNPILAKIRNAKAEAHDAMANAYDQLDGQSQATGPADKVAKADAVVAEFLADLRADGGLFGKGASYNDLL
jgi:hypothetical protein